MVQVPPEGVKVIVPAQDTMKCTVYAPLDLHKALWQRRIDSAAHPSVSDSFIEGARMLLAKDKADRERLEAEVKRKADRIARRLKRGRGQRPKKK